MTISPGCRPPWKWPLGDRTIGWRDYADQSVKFERLEDGKITEKAAFAVGVWKGELENAGVESIEGEPRRQ